MRRLICTVLILVATTCATGCFVSQSAFAQFAGLPPGTSGCQWEGLTLTTTMTDPELPGYERMNLSLEDCQTACDYRNIQANRYPENTQIESLRNTCDSWEYWPVVPSTFIDAMPANGLCSLQHWVRNSIQAPPVSHPSSMAYCSAGTFDRKLPVPTAQNPAPNKPPTSGSGPSQPGPSIATNSPPGLTGNPPIFLPPVNLPGQPRPGPTTATHPPPPGPTTTTNPPPPKVATLPPATLPPPQNGPQSPTGVQPPAPPVTKPGGSGGTIYGGSCKTVAGTTTCTGDDGRTCTTTTSNFCDPAKSGAVSPPPAPAKTANTTPTQSCQSNPQLPPWGRTSSSSMTVGAGGSCGIGWTDSNGVTLDHLSVKKNPSHGTVQLQGKGSLTYTAASGYTGPDSFSVSIEEHYRDGRSATAGSNVSVTVK